MVRLESSPALRRSAVTSFLFVFVFFNRIFKECAMLILPRNVLSTGRLDKTLKRAWKDFIKNSWNWLIRELLSLRLIGLGTLLLLNSFFYRFLEKKKTNALCRDIITQFDCFRLFHGKCDSNLKSKTKTRFSFFVFFNYACNVGDTVSCFTCIMRCLIGNSIWTHGAC